MKKRLLFIFLLNYSILLCQDSAEIYKKLKKLKTLSSVLYIAAHPDDENTRLISLFSNHYYSRTAYLSLTRGDGGQNLIGTELGEALGLIRTQELLEARRIDGGIQYFTTANDFGFSKHPDETLSIWNKEEILAQIVYLIRSFKPDIIVNRFDHRTPGTTHGHHTSSAILSKKAFQLASDPSAFPDQLSKVDIWKPKRQFYNTSWWAYGGKEQFRRVDKSKFIPIDSNPIDFLTGQTNEEVAALSRSQHKSQGFGISPSIGKQLEYLELINGDNLLNSNPFDQIDTTWSRIRDGKKIEKLINQIIADFDFEEPSNSILLLANLYKEISKIENNHWKKIKLKEVRDIIKGCLGLRLQFNSSVESGVDKTKISTELIASNSSNFEIELINVDGALNIDVSKKLSNNQVWNVNKNLSITDAVTTPYWLLEEKDLGNYKVKNKNLIGLAETPNPIKIYFNFKIQEVQIPIEIPLTYRKTDRVIGEVVQDFQILPRVTSKIENDVILFSNENPKNITVTVNSNVNNFSGDVSLMSSENWEFSPKSQIVNIEKSGTSKEFIFRVIPPKGNSKTILKSIVKSENKEYKMSLEEINYPHIQKQFLLSPNKTIVSKIDLKTKINEIAYINGAGDKISESLRNVGIKVKEFDVDKLKLESLLEYSTVVVGIRAFNVHNDLAFKNQILWDFAMQGGTVIIQYNTSRNFDSSILAPFRINISRERVTDENAHVTILNKEHILLKEPNKITEIDFNDWVQERGLYFANSWDKRYEALFSMNDKGESEKKGSLLVADCGKGKFIFTGLSFFRQLPSGVPGAYRLFLNLISYGK